MENLKLNNYYKFSTNVKDHIEMDMGWIVSEWRKLRRTIPEPGIDSISKFMFLTELWIFRQSASGACFYRKSIDLDRGARFRVHLEILHPRHGENQAIMTTPS
jgi:hypothetical protein